MKLNNLQVIGRIGQDAKIIDHQSRKFVAFSLAVDESYKNNEGVKVERTVWYDCATDQERFFKVISWLSKGREVFVEGKPSVRTYEKEGKIYGAIRIQVQNISLGHSPNDERPAAPAPVATAPARTMASQPAPAPFLTQGANDETNDLPF